MDLVEGKICRKPRILPWNMEVLWSSPEKNPLNQIQDKDSKAAKAPLHRGNTWKYAINLSQLRRRLPEFIPLLKPGFLGCSWELVAFTWPSWAQHQLKASCKRCRKYDGWKSLEESVLVLVCLIPFQGSSGSSPSLQGFRSSLQLRAFGPPSSQCAARGWWLVGLNKNCPPLSHFGQRV